MKIHLDFETYSDLDIKEVGAHRYAEHYSSEILLVGFAIGNSPVKVVEPNDPQIEELLSAVREGGLVCAHNANFEKAIWENVGVNKLGWPSVPLTHWRCTAARARALALPNSLADLAIALGLPILKDKAGDALIRKYCGLNRKGERTLFADNPEDFLAFKNYCQRDVEVEIAIDKTIPELSEFELKVFHHDMEVNTRGIPIDVSTLTNALEIIKDLENHFSDASIALAGFKATQRNKVLEWLSERGLDLPDLTVETLEQAATRTDLTSEVKEFLELRYESSRVGTKKAKKMADMVCDDGTIKGSFLYHSATTGRWGSRGVQLQNMSRPETQEQADKVIEMLATGTATDLLAEFDRPLTAISKSMRGFIKAPEGSRFLVADFSSIEAKTLAWLADEPLLMEAYCQGKDVYKEMAGKIYNIAPADVNGKQRKIGKVTVLGCGYGMGVKKFHADCETNQLGISAEEAAEIVGLYRENVPNITDYWDNNNIGLIKAIATNKEVIVKKCSFQVVGDFLYITLPSGRKIAFSDPRVEVNEWGKPQAVVSKFIGSKRFPERLWGGIITQNICQATARDFLVNGMMVAEENGYPVVMHVHDECISLLPNNVGSIGDFEQQLTTVPNWAPGFPLTSEGYESMRYRK